MPTTVERVATIEAALNTWTRRNHGPERPDGRSSNTANRWYPTDQERRPCCNAIRSPSRAWPWSLYRHCHSVQHIANLHGVSATELRRAIRAREG